MIFSKDIVKCCAYCERATKITMKEQVLCPHKGIMDAGSSCRKFRYTPLKRSPQPKVLNKEGFTKEDFEI
jgi:hypothetical protein